MTPASTGRIFTLLALGFVSACTPGQNPFQRNANSGADTSVATQKSVKLVDRDVEAPDVFAVSDTALWDGRPSLGGVWVASPDAVDPERVIMRNPANGKFVIGALFKRERDNPGPSLQISSDAAAALGLLAGQPAQISVTALRREEAPAQVNANAPLLDGAETVQTETLGGGEVVGGAVVGTPTSGAVIGSTAPAPMPAQIDISPVIATNPPAPMIAPSSGPYIQSGIFSVEANANRAVTSLTAAGVPAIQRRETAQGKTYWSVGARGDASVLAKIKAAGFKDAYVTKG